MGAGQTLVGVGAAMTPLQDPSAASQPSPPQATASQVIDQYLLEGRHDPEQRPLLPDEAIQLYLLAGASIEAHNAVRTRLSYAPQDPWASAVAVELDCWDPGSFAHGQQLAAQWLQRHGKENPGLESYVRTRLDWLDAQAVRDQQLARAETLARVAPLLAVLLAVLLLRAMLRFGSSQ